MKVNTKSSDYQDGYKDGFDGRRDKSEAYARNWGFQAGTDYCAGYRKGEADAEGDKIHGKYYTR